MRTIAVEFALAKAGRAQRQIQEALAALGDAPDIGPVRECARHLIAAMGTIADQAVALRGDQGVMVLDTLSIPTPPAGWVLPVERQHAAA